VDDCLVCGVKFHFTLHTSHPHRMAGTGCRVNTVVSPDGGRMVARGMWREYTSNKYTKSELCTELALFTKYLFCIY